MPMCNKHKVFLYEIDKRRDFFKMLNRHEDKLSCQHLYFMHYKNNCPEMIDKDNEHYSEV